MGSMTATIDRERRTSADHVFEKVRDDIISLSLPPGTKLSEAEMAKWFGVSRQPVREALIRLNGISLVRIQPQRATVVRGISRSQIERTRFIRMAVEVEVARIAASRFAPSMAPKFQENLRQQDAAVQAGRKEEFNTLDYAFHHLICTAAGRGFAFETISENKVYVDRLCMVELSAKERMRQTFDDHQRIFDRLAAGDEDGLIDAVRLHLSRLTETIDSAYRSHPEYFED